MLKKQAGRVVGVFKVLSTESRVRILQLLLRERRSMTVGEIAAALEMTESATSHQLRILFDAGAVGAVVEGRHARYAFLSTGRARLFRRALKVA